MSLLRPTLSCAALAVLTACSEPSYKQNTDNAIGDAGDASTLPLRDGDAEVRAVGDADVRDALSAPDTGRPRDAREEDAKTPEAGQGTPGNDAGSPPVVPVVPEPEVGPSTPVVPAWAESIRGAYASRAYAFRQDDFATITRASQVSLHNFVLTEGGLVMTTKSCSYRASNSLSDLRMVDASNTPERSENVLFSSTEQRWSTEGPAFPLGYTRAPPEICKGKLGESVPKPVEHVWYTGARCRCALEDEQPLADDCRVLDPDGDRHPGFTYKLTSTLVGNFDIYGGSESSSHVVNAQLRDDGTMRANIRSEDVNYQFGCTPDCANIAVLGKGCPSSLNSMEFVPLKDAAPTCASILGALSTLFPAAVPDYPMLCFQ